MKLVRFFGVGKTRIRFGSPLPILLLLESTTANGQEKRSEIECAITAVPGLDGESPSVGPFPLSYKGSARSAPSALVDIYEMELDTGKLAPGAYQIATTEEDIKLSMDQMVWVLTPHDFRELLLEEIDIGIDYIPNILHLELGLSLDRKGLESLVREIVSTIFAGFLVANGEVDVRPKVTIRYTDVNEGHQVPADPLAYFITAIAEEYRYIAFPGVQSIEMDLAISKSKFTFGALVELRNPLNDFLKTDYDTAHKNDLLLLTNVVQEKFKAQTMQAIVQVVSKSIAFSWSMDANTYAYASA